MNEITDAERDAYWRKRIEIERRQMRWETSWAYEALYFLKEALKGALVMFFWLVLIAVLLGVGVGNAMLVLR